MTEDPRVIARAADAAVGRASAAARFDEATRRFDELLGTAFDELRRKGDAAARERSPVGQSVYGLPVVPSSLVKPGEFVVVAEPPRVELGSSPDPIVGILAMTRIGAAYYNPRNAAGYPSAIERVLRPVPGYTDRTVAAREAARDWRRHRRRR